MSWPSLSRRSHRWTKSLAAEPAAKAQEAFGGKVDGDLSGLFIEVEAVEQRHMRADVAVSRWHSGFEFIDEGLYRALMGDIIDHVDGSLQHLFGYDYE